MKSRIRAAASTIATIVCAVVLTIGYVSCQDRGADVVRSDGISVSVTRSSILLTNSTSETVYYIVAELRTSEVIDWLMGCDILYSVRVGETKEIPYSKVEGYYGGCEVWLAWWHCITVTPAAPRPGPMQTVIFRAL